MTQPQAISVAAASVVGVSVRPLHADIGPGPAYSPDSVSSQIREALLACGLGQKLADVPLADVVEPGATVLIKPNWVVHEHRRGEGRGCLVTHEEFILAALREVLAARPGRVIVGDAPIQMCNWKELVPRSLTEQIKREGHTRNVPVEVTDFRRTTMRRGMLNAVVQEDLRPAERFIVFDLRDDSILEPLSRSDARFRVADYNPDYLARTHGPGRHEYLLCEEALHADVVLSLPKLKTHQKAGITGALKNLVGLNGNKDYLPHHRLGSPRQGGDCYPRGSRRKRLAERLEDAANRRLGNTSYVRWRLAARAARLLAAGDAGRMDGAWYGNDTVWRMVLDLNRIVRYGRPDGTMSDIPQRRVVSLTDAIIAGQGDGPLRPDPLVLGVVTCSESPVAADTVHAALMQLDSDRIPLVREASGTYRWPLTADSPRPECRLGAERLSVEQVALRLGKPSIPARGWMGHIEMGPPRRHELGGGGPDVEA